ncbi:MAG: ABC transporter permease [Chloroflexota bacterium]|nr:ABC transporter permease [Chloroflexota bacterium]
MNELFGLSMTTIMLVLLVLLGLCLLSVAWVAWRRPVIFKLGVRNIPRRKAQTVLIVLGLMLSTLLISAALGIGDTVRHSETAHVYALFDHVDELVVASEEVEAEAGDATNATFDAGVLGPIETALAEDRSVDGILPALDVTAPVLNRSKGLGEPEAVLTGIDPGRLAPFGGLQGVDGGPIDLGAMAPEGVVVNRKTADQLDAKVGDALTVYYGNAPLSLTVAAVAEESLLSGSRYPGYLDEPALPGLVMPLDRLQRLTGQEGRLSLIALSNWGGVRQGVEGTDRVVATLAPVLAGKQLGIAAIKRDGVEGAEGNAQGAAATFLVMGLFSIAAGLLLIVLIFTMLAAERRPEMGIARAVGAHRRQLVQLFVAEGAGYALLAGLVGSALGVLAAFGIATAIQFMFGESVRVDPHVEPRSLVVAYCLGVVVTFATVVAASWRISRLNIVAAVRDIPDVSSPRRKKRTLVWAAMLLVAGSALALVGQRSDVAASFLTGMSLLPFGTALILRFIGARVRPVFTPVGCFLLVLWLLPQELSARLWGDLDGGPELFFLSGIFMVVGATIVIVNNLDVLLAGLGLVGGVFRSQLPAVRTAIAYPRATPGRTGMTMAMFSLIVFSLVMMASMSRNLAELFLSEEANAGWHVRADARNVNPIADFGGTLRARGVDTSNFRATGVLTSPNLSPSRMRLTGTASWKEREVYGMDRGFIANTELAFQQRAAGYPTDEAIVQALLTQPGVAVIDPGAVPSGFEGGEPDSFLLTGLDADDEAFAPIEVELQGPAGEPPLRVTIIGVIDGRLADFWGLFAAQPTLDAIDPAPTVTSYYVALDDPARAVGAAREIEAALLANGVQAVSVEEERAEEDWFTGFFYIIGGFMALGLIVGIAAVGVVAFRAVVERRQQIGVVRAIGYRRGLVALSFLIEASFVVALGVVSGTVLGLVQARNLFASEELAGADVDFVIPWNIILGILMLTAGMALLMTWIPAYQASRVPPAEALRYE